MDDEPLSHARKAQKLARKTSRGEHSHERFLQYGQVRSGARSHSVVQKHGSRKLRGHRGNRRHATQCNANRGVRHHDECGARYYGKASRIRAQFRSSYLIHDASQHHGLDQGDNRGNLNDGSPGPYNVHFRGHTPRHGLQSIRDRAQGDIHHGEPSGSRARYANHLGDARYHEYHGVNLHAEDGAHGRQRKSNSGQDAHHAQVQHSGTHRAPRLRSVLRHQDEEHDPSNPSSPVQSVHLGDVQSHGIARASGAIHMDEHARMGSLHAQYACEWQSWISFVIEQIIEIAIRAIVPEAATIAEPEAFANRASLCIRRQLRVPYATRPQPQSQEFRGGDKDCMHKLLHTCCVQEYTNRHIDDTQAHVDKGLSGGKGLQDCRESEVLHHIDTGHDGVSKIRHHDAALLGYGDIDLHSLARIHALHARYGCSVARLRHRNDHHSSWLSLLAFIRCDLGWAQF